MENNKNSGQYIWRTVQDDKVRSSHAARAGETFFWTNPPEGGHPGEAFGCRCWAEAVAQTASGLQQEIISSLYQASYKWTYDDFINHWKNGAGREVTLPEIGWTVGIVNHAKEIMFHKVEKQIADKARQVQSGNFSDTWERSYNFQEVVFSIGDAVIRGRFNGNVKKDKGVLHIEATVYYLLDDAFTDTSSVRQRVLGSSNPGILWDNIIGDATLYITEAGNKPYPITGTWITKVTGSIKSTN